MSEMTLKTNYRDITYEVNPGVAHQIDSLVSQHPDTKIKGEAPASTSTTEQEDLQRRYDMAIRQRDRARTDRDRYAADLNIEQELNYARVKILSRLLNGIERDLDAGVHPGSILKQVKTELQAQANNGFDRIPTDGYMSGRYAERISARRRQAETRRLLNEAYSEPVTAPVPDEPLPAPSETLADWEESLTVINEMTPYRIRTWDLMALPTTLPFDNGCAGVVR